MPQCCYLAKGAKRPSHTTNTIKFDRIPFDPCTLIKRFDLCPFDQINSTYLQPPRSWQRCVRKKWVSVKRSTFSGRKDRGRNFWSNCRDRTECGRIWSKLSDRKRSLFASSRLNIIMWGIYCVCTLALTVAKTSSHYDRSRSPFPLVVAPVRPPLARWEHKQPQGAAWH